MKLIASCVVTILGIIVTVEGMIQATATMIWMTETMDDLSHQGEVRVYRKGKFEYLKTEEFEKQ